MPCQDRALMKAEETIRTNRVNKPSKTEAISATIYRSSEMLITIIDFMECPKAPT